jgi:iron complex transport system permease protein
VVSPGQEPRSIPSTGVVSAEALGVLSVVLVVGLLGSMVVAVVVGAVDLSPTVVVRVVLAEVFDTAGADDVPGHIRQIVWELRAPRVVMAAIVGAGLAVVGVAVQALVRNALADPYVLGVSSGASVGAAIVILFGGLASLGTAAISVAAFLTATIAMGLVYLVAQERGTLPPMRLVLVGVVMSHVFAAITSFLVFRGDPRGAQQVLFWLLGSFGRARWSALVIPAVVFVVVFGALALRARQLDALTVGDTTAATLGIGVTRLRTELFLSTAALTAVLVAVSGAVGFVGLVVPHTARLLVGGRHHRVLPLAAVVGALFMVWVDVAARTLAAPEEVPLGIITAVVGAPVFVVLLRHRDRRLRSAP